MIPIKSRDAPRSRDAPAAIIHRSSGEPRAGRKV